MARTPVDAQLASNSVLASDTVPHASATVIEASNASLTNAASNNSSVARPVSVEDIVNWSIRGTGDDVIIDRIEHCSNSFHLSPSQEIHLRDAGVSDEVIRAMKATAN